MLLMSYIGSSFKEKSGIKFSWCQNDHKLNYFDVKHIIKVKRTYSYEIVHKLMCLEMNHKLM